MLMTLVLLAWKFSVAALVAIAGSFAATIGVLVSYDGQPVPTAPHSVTVGAVIAVLATALQSLLAYVVGSCTCVQAFWVLRPF